jgi:hypothetical protein
MSFLIDLSWQLLFYFILLIFAPDAKETVASMKECFGRMCNTAVSYVALKSITEPFPCAPKAKAYCRGAPFQDKAALILADWSSGPVRWCLNSNLEKRVSS